MSAPKAASSPASTGPKFSDSLNTAIVWWLIGKYVTTDPGGAWAHMIRSWWSPGPVLDDDDFALVHPAVDAFIDVMSASGEFAKDVAFYAMAFFLLKGLIIWGVESYTKKKAEAAAAGGGGGGHHP